MCESIILKQYGRNTIAISRITIKYNEMGDFTNCSISFHKENTRKTLSFTLYGKRTEDECLEMFDKLCKEFDDMLDENSNDL